MTKDKALKDYFWIEARGELLNENFTDLINFTGRSADTLKETINVDGVGEVLAYQIDLHSLITFISKSDKATDFRVFTRKGPYGKIRLYHNYHKHLADSPSRRSRQELADMIKRASEIRNSTPAKK